jgi:hypothetical protein
MAVVVQEAGGRSCVDLDDRRCSSGRTTTSLWPHPEFFIETLAMAIVKSPPF